MITFLLIMSAFDTHIHLDLVDNPVAQLESARRTGIHGWIIPGVDNHSWSSAQRLAEQEKDVFFAPGLHPQTAKNCTSLILSELRQRLNHPKAIALGEVGLDRSINIPWKEQEELFIKMIHLALEYELPLLLHTRKCIQQTLNLLRREGNGRLRGIFHAFSGSIESAREVVDLGFIIGVGGAVTWPTAKRLPGVIKQLSPQELVLETDAPFMSPEPLQGHPNKAENLFKVAERVASLKDWTLEETCRITTKNAKKLFNL